MVEKNIDYEIALTTFRPKYITYDHAQDYKMCLDLDFQVDKYESHTVTTWACGQCGLR